MASETRQDPERIYLEPAPYSPEGRLWCEDDVWPLDGDGPGGVEYIRADLHATEIARLTRELEAERGISRARGEDLTEALGHLSALVDMLHHDGHIERCGDHAASLVSAAERYLESPSREQEVGAATAEIADRLAALRSAPSGVEEGESEWEPMSMSMAGVAHPRLVPFRHRPSGVVAWVDQRAAARLRGEGGGE